MKTIIHATDFSENSIAALKYAYEFSTKIKATLWVFHVFNISTLGSDLNEPFLLPRDEAKQQKYAKLKEFCKHYLGANYEAKQVKVEAIENDSIIEGIIKKATDLNALAIVTGMKGKSAVENFIMGNTTIQLINKAPCPILAIPTISKLKNIKTVVYATDFEQEDVSAISKLISLLKPFKPTIKITHVSTKKEYDGQLQMEWFKEILLQKVDYDNLEFDLFFSDDIFEILTIYLKEVEADLIAMLERKKIGIVKKIFHQDLVQKMESKSNIPLLSFNEANY
jgi:nucleotide-binding universal stress UspA family protein